MIGPFDSSGFPVGCKSACLAGLAPDPGKLSLSITQDEIFSEHCIVAQLTTRTAARVPTTPQPRARLPACSSMTTSVRPRSAASSTCAGILTMSTRAAPYRAELPQLVRIRIRRVERHRALYLRFEPSSRLHRHLLPVSWYLRVLVLETWLRDVCNILTYYINVTFT